MRSDLRLLALLALCLLVSCAGAPATPTALPILPEPAVTAATVSATTVPATAAPSPTPEPTLAPGTYRNPVFNQDFPDPDVLRVDATYYAYATNSGHANIQVARSQDLVRWTWLPNALPILPSWATTEFGYTWAPEVTTDAGGETFLMYYTARYAMGFGGVQCIGVATSDQPEGPFRSPDDEPFICQRDEGGSIDASAFVDDDGKRYLLWKNDGNSRGLRTWLYIQQVSDDGLALLGEPTPLITADQSWEGILVEAPTLWKQDGRYYLFYSANDYASPHYAVGYAVAGDIFGPYEKAPRPILATDIAAGIVGPGGQDVVIGPDGETWLLFHAWAGGGYRHLNLAPLTWEDGRPVVAGLGREPQPSPAVMDEA